MGQEIVCDYGNIDMEDDEDIPDLCLDNDVTFEKKQREFVEKSETDFANSNGVATEESVKNAEEFSWPVYDFCWQDFVPAALCPNFGHSSKDLPSLLSIVSDVSETVPNGALWFNFVFDWWFVEPLQPIDEPSDPTINLDFPCAKCEQKFQRDWEVTRHYIDKHLAAAPVKKEEIKPEPTVTKEPSPVKEIIKEPEPEEEPEIYVEPYPLLLDWRWQDFLPDWSETFLPSAYFDYYATSDIEDDDPDPPPQVIKETTPQPSPPKKRKFVLVNPAPVLKQTKYHCRTCDLTICNSCFSKKCGAHAVDFKGTAKFSCGLC